MASFRRLAHLLLLALVLSACTLTGTPAASVPTATNAYSATAPDSTTTGPQSTAQPTSTRSAPLAFDPAGLRGVKILVYHAFAGAAADLFNAQVNEFNAGNQWGITVSALGQGDYQTLDLAVQAGSQTAAAPALVVALPEQILKWNAAGSVVDLNPYLNDPTWGLAADAIADVPSIFWDSAKFDGKLLGLPAQRSARFLYYNRTWAHELGFDQPPASAADMQQQACAANASFKKDTDPKNDGYGGWIVDTQWQTVYAWMLAFGGDVADGNTYGFRTDPDLAALKFIKGLYDQHCAWISTEPAPFDSFARRSALFISADLAEIPLEREAMARLKNGDDWTVLPFPGTQENSLVLYGPSYTLLKSTPEQQMAGWLFARWLLSPESQARWVEATGLFPLRLSVKDMIGPYRSAYPQWEAALGELNAVRTVPQLASWDKVRYVLEDGLAGIFQANTPIDKLPGVLEQMDAMAKELNK
jgi:multiple sugar transport system substrate-binding protein